MKVQSIIICVMFFFAGLLNVFIVYVFPIELNLIIGVISIFILIYIKIRRYKRKKYELFKNI